MGLHVNLKGSGIGRDYFEQYRPLAEEKLNELWNGGLDYTGWIRHPLNMKEEDLVSIETAAEKIRRQSDFFIVLGVGGSYIGARAVIDLLGNDGSDTKVIFAGYHFSARYMRDLFQRIQGKDISLCVISKSGSTAETMVAYGILRDYMIRKYGPEEAAERTCVVTETRPNPLYGPAAEEGMGIFELAEDIGGRYSVLTAVGMLPAAAAGIDIRRIVRGAASIASMESFKGEGLDYAIARHYFYRTGKTLEIFEFFDPYAAYFGEWLKQLFGESEGKERKGLFPASLIFSRDLHSVGQFLQQGTECFFETLITSGTEEGEDVFIPEDTIDPFAGRTLKQLNSCAVSGVYDAHVKAGIPVIRVDADRFDPETMGEMIYFFETQCAVSALLLDVNPFDQPGVEAYKSEMRSYIKKLL